MASSWFVWLELACAGGAALLWYGWPQLGAWPLLLGLLPWAVRPVVTKRLWPTTPFDLPLWLFVATAGVAVWSAYDKPVAWAKFWLIVAGVLLFYAVANATRHATDAGKRPDALAPAWGMAAFGSAVALYFFATHDYVTYPAPLALLTDLGRVLQLPFSPLTNSAALHQLHPNVVAGLLIVMLPFGAVVAQSMLARRAWLWGVLAVSAVVLMLFALLLTHSRGAWLALAVSAVVALLWRLTHRRRAWFGVGMGLFALIGGVGMVWLLANLGDGQSRLELARSSLPLVADYPFIGAGLGGFMMLYSSYALLVHVGYIIHAHNLFLDVAIEQGLIALVALGWMWVLMAVLVWREMDLGRVRPLLAAGGLSLVALLTHGLLEDALYGSRAVVVLFLPLAFALSLPQKETARASGWRWALPPAVALVVVALAVLIVPSWRSYAVSNLAAVDQSRTELSRYSWPEWPLQDALRREVDLSDTIAGFENALRLNPANGSANRRLGQIELSQGRYDAALTHLEAAYAQQPNCATARQLVGEALVVNGRGPEGLVLLQSVPTAQGQLDARVYWYGFLQETEAHGWVAEAAASANE